MTRFVALVCRLSPRPDGSYEGVDAQEKWGREYAETTWPGLPVRVYADRGLSAGDRKVRRPDFERFKADLSAGSIVHVWAVELSRTWRDEIGWFHLAAELVAAGITELHTNRDGIVRVEDEVAGIKAVVAAAERRKMLRRQSDTLAEKAACGIPPGSRPFGYVHSETAEGVRTYRIVSEQADAIRWAADAVLAGWSLENVAKALAAKGIQGAHRVKVRDEHGEIVTDDRGRPVTRPTRIEAASLKRILTNHTVAGKRVHKGRVVGEGNWEPILDEQTWHAVRLKLSTPRTVKRTDGGMYPINAKPRRSRRRYLLTGGVAECGACHAPMIGAMKQLRSKVRVTRRPYYLCHPNKGGRGCVAIGAEDLEVYVRDKMYAEFDKPGFLDRLTADDNAQERDRIEKALVGVESQRNELAEQWALPLGHADALTLAEWRTARHALSATEQALRFELASLPPPVHNVDMAKLRKASWPGLTLDEKRDLVETFVDKVTIAPGVRGRKGFDSKRVDIEFR